MQDQEGRRALFVRGEKNATPANVINQALRTSNAEINKIERDKEQQINDISRGIKSVLDIYSTGKYVRNEINQANLLSAQTELTKNQIEYENLVSSGGVIDNENIPLMEKITKKQQAFNNLQLSTQQSKQILENKKGIFQAILGTEDAYNQALAKFDNGVQETLNVAQRQLTQEVKQTEIAISKQNAQAIFNSVNTANSRQGVDKIRDLSIRTIFDLERNGYITSAESENALNDLSKNINNRNVDIDINNAMHLASMGLPNEAMNLLQTQYSKARSGKDYVEFYGQNKELAQANRIENETRLRNAYFSLQGQINSQKADIILNNLDYSRPAIENINLIDKATASEPQAIKDKALSTFKETQKLYNDKPADFLYNRNPNASVNEVQNWLNSQGLGDKSAVASNSQIVSSMKSDFSNLGNLTTEKNQTPSIRDQFEIIYQGYLEKFIPVSQTTGQEITIQRDERMSQGEKLFAKEVKIHGEGVDYMLLQARNNEDEDFLSELINIRVQKNSPKGLVNKKETPTKIKDYLSSAHQGLQYEKNKDPELYKKLQGGILEVSNVTGQSINEVVDKVYKNNDFIINEKTNVKIDTTKYNKSDINSRITIARKNALQIFGNQKNIIGKYDLAENLFVYSNDTGDLEFILKDQKGNEDFLGILSPNDLPEQTYINPFENLSQTTKTKNVNNADLGKTFNTGIREILGTPFK